MNFSGYFYRDNVRLVVCTSLHCGWCVYNARVPQAKIWRCKDSCLPSHPSTPTLCIHKNLRE